MLPKKFAVIEFNLNDGTEVSEAQNLVAVVHNSWMIGLNKCCWPKVNQAKMSRFRRDGKEPDDDWEKHNCRILGTFDDLQTARQKAVLAEDTSNLESDDGYSSRRIKQPNRFINQGNSPEAERLHDHKAKRQKMYQRNDKENNPDNEFQPTPSLSYDNLGEVPEVNQTESSSEQLQRSLTRAPMDRISRIADIEKVNRIVRKAGYQPYTEEGSYYVAALQLKKTILISEKLDALMERSQLEVQSRETKVHFPNPVLTNKSDVETLGQWTDTKKIDLKTCLKKEGGSTVQEMTKRFVKRLADERLLCQFNRTGSDGKEKFKGEMEDLIKEAVSEYCDSSGICYDGKKVELKIASMLKVASDKHTAKKYRPNRLADRD